MCCHGTWGREAEGAWSCQLQLCQAGPDLASPRAHGGGCVAGALRDGEGAPPGHPDSSVPPQTESGHSSLAPKRDLEGKCISGEDGLMGASDEPNIYLTVPPDDGDAGAPLPK